MTSPAYSPFLYTLSRLVVTFGLRIYHRFSVRGVENVPRFGGCILAANHVSFLDPPVLACAVPFRVVRFMARDTLFRKKWFGWLLHKIAVIPISRDRGDVGALKRGITMLRSGECLGIFPEGTRSPMGEIQEAKGGIAFLIAKANVPVVPAYIQGSFEAYPKGARRIKPCKVQIIFGAPILPKEFEALGVERDAYEKIGNLVMSRIKALKPSA